MIFWQTKCYSLQALQNVPPVLLNFVQLGFSVSKVTDKKAQLNTDLLKQRHEYLYKKVVVWLKLNEIRSVIKMGEILIKQYRLKFGEAFWKGGWGVFVVKHFCNGYENLKQMPKNYKFSGPLIQFLTRVVKTFVLVSLFHGHVSHRAKESKS